ncbi:MAG TPA: PKD domain-containing protein [Chitinophagales bacterium]|nr:PKD domain-containing protein [Chitinophagales bacterium]
MRLKYTYYLLVFCFVWQQGFGQKHANNWYFSASSIKFGTGVAVPSFTEMSPFEGCTSISDSLGNLLFYSDGSSVWNRNHEIMANGYHLSGGQVSTQAAMAVAHPDSSNLYYLFTLDEAGGSDGLCYSIIDMNLDNGNGDVTAVKNIKILSRVCEKIAVTRHANKHDLWIIVNRFDSDSMFYSYKLTSQGIDTNPVIMTGLGRVGPIISVGNIAAGGYMKVSPDGKWLVSCISGSGFMKMYRFDNTTGLVEYVCGDASGLPPKEHAAYGLEFSPDSRLVYISENVFAIGPNMGHIYQYNLYAGNAAAIVASRKTLVSGHFLGALQLGPDHKIYVAHRGQPVRIIHRPNAVGPACQFDTVHSNSGLYYSGLGLPTFVHPYFDVGIKHQPACFGSPTIVSVTNPNIDSVKWDFGDTASAAANYSKLTTAQHFFTATGNYTVTLTAYDQGLIDTTYLKVSITDTVPQLPLLGPDTLLCPGGTLMLDCYMAGATYKWSNNTTQPYLNATQPGLYSVTVNDRGCTSADSILIGYRDSVYISATALAWNEYAFTTTDTQSIGYVWAVGNTTISLAPGATYLFAEEGTYNIKLTVTDSDGCVRIRTQKITIVNTGIVSGQTAGITVFPSPGTGNYQLQYTAAKNEELTLTLYNQTGSQLSTTQWQTTTGLNQHNIDLSNYPAGIYFAHVNSATQSVVIKIVKQ